MARPFPDEAGWLQLPLPPEAEQSGLPSADFVARVVQAIDDERALDRDLAAADRDLPRILLQGHAAPAPSPDFVDRTLAAVQDDRRARWQHLLARHVAPEPSPQFVQRTLAALAADERTPPMRSLPRAARRWPRRWPLAAAAAAAALWLWTSLQRDASPAFETRLANAAAPAFAHAWTSSPSGIVLARQADLADQAALADGAPDGLWLAFTEVR